MPTEDVKGVPSTPRAPKALAKRELDQLLRAAEQDGVKRNLALSWPKRPSVRSPYP